MPSILKFSGSPSIWGIYSILQLPSNASSHTLNDKFLAGNGSYRWRIRQSGRANSQQDKGDWSYCTSITSLPVWKVLEKGLLPCSAYNLHYQGLSCSWRCEWEEIKVLSSNPSLEIPFGWSLKWLRRNELLMWRGNTGMSVPHGTWVSPSGKRHRAHQAQG